MDPELQEQLKEQMKTLSDSLRGDLPVDPSVEQCE